MVSEVPVGVVEPNGPFLVDEALVGVVEVLPALLGMFLGIADDLVDDFVDDFLSERMSRRSVG